MLAELNSKSTKTPVWPGRSTPRALPAGLPRRLGCPPVTHTPSRKRQIQGNGRAVGTHPPHPLRWLGGQVVPIPVFSLETAAAISFPFLDGKHLQSPLLCRGSISFRSRGSSRVADCIGFVPIAFPAAALKWYLLIMGGTQMNFGNEAI